MKTQNKRGRKAYANHRLRAELPLGRGRGQGSWKPPSRDLLSKYPSVPKIKKRTELVLKFSNFSTILWLEVSMSANDPETLTWIRECYLSQRIRAISAVPTSNSERWKIKDASGLRAILKLH